MPEDDRQAVFWYRKAAEQGFADAQNNLGGMYANGEGVPEDDRQAVFWFRKAAEQEVARAQYNLGAMYANGEGVPEDYVRAYAWFNLAAAQGDEDAERFRAELRQWMTPAQIAEGQALSRQLAARIESGSGGATASPVPADPASPSDPSRDTVLWTQTHLTLLGYDPGPLNGLPGRRTTEAVRRFQRDFGLAATGRVSEELLALLMAVAAARQTEPLEPKSSGSGFVVGGSGDVVTNHHVVDGCARVTVSRAGTSHDVRSPGHRHRR